MADDAILLARVGITGVDAFQSGVDTAAKAFISLGDTFESVGGGLVNILGMVAGGFAAAATAFTAFTALSVAEAVKIDRYRMTLAGLYDSMEEGEKRIAYIRQYARRSLLSSDTLLELGTTSEAGGVNFSKIMSTIDLLSRGNAERARQLTDALVRGSTGANLARTMQTLTRSGIGYNDLRAAGIEVSSGNRVNATGGQFVQAILDIAKKKFPELGEYLKNAMQTKIVDLQDSWNQMTEAFGRAWFPMISRLISGVTPLINFMTDTGRIEALGKSFNNAFGRLFGAAGGESVLDRMFLTFFTGVELMPSAIEKVGTFIIHLVQSLDGAFTKFANNINNSLVEFYNFFNGIDRAVVAFGKGVWQIGVRLSQLFGMNKGVDTSAERVFADLDRERPVMTFKPFHGASDAIGELIKQAGGGAVMNLGNEFNAAFAKNKSDFDKYMKSPKTELPDPSKGLFNKIHQDGVDAQKQTAENTARIAAHMVDFKRYTLGGGDFAQRGISVTELYGSRGAMGKGRLAVDVRSGNAKLDEALGDMFTSFLHEYHRDNR